MTRLGRPSQRPRLKSWFALHWSAACFWALFVCAGCLYLVRLGELAFTTDEIYHGIAARAILANGKPTLPDGSLYMKGALFSYLGAIFSYIFGSIEFGVRFVSLVCALATGLVIRQFAARISGASAGLLASFLWFFHPWVVEFARWGRLYTLAALLLIGALHAFSKYDAGASSRWLWAAAGLVLLTTSVYPLGVLGGLVIVICSTLRIYQRRPEWRARLAVGAFITAGLAASLVWALVLHGDEAFVLLEKRYGWRPTVFTGATGQAVFSVSQFVGYSALYPRFFLQQLWPFALSLLAWGARCLVGETRCYLKSRAGFSTDVEGGLVRRDATELRQCALVLLTTFGGLLFVTFVHLQEGATRYLYPLFPLMVAGSACFVSSTIHRYLRARSTMAHLALGAIGLAAFIHSGSFQVPWRTYGDPFPNPLFAPTPALSFYANFKDPALHVRAHAAPDDLVVTNIGQFYYFYAQQEADYNIRFRHEPRTKRMPYMSKTKPVVSHQDLIRIIQGIKARKIWLVLGGNPIRGDALARHVFRRFPFQLDYQHPEDPNAKVFTLQR
jgi:4-amino-4-deoxy-L-arabinose transferase-like glycosyltransferase